VSEKRPGVDVLLAVFEGVREEDVEEVERLLKGVDIKKLALLLRELSDNADAILSLIEVAKMLKETGTMAALKGLLEVSDETFNAVARAEVMRALGNLMMLVYMLSLFDNFTLMRAAETTPKCVDVAVREASRVERGLGLLELLSIMRSPEVATALRAFTSFMKCVRGKS
jgi:uncharacterized protein YjgD (DUF1641 family)